jgi:hypothetical protein
LAAIKPAIGKKPEKVLFFSWNNSLDPQYIPLRPILESLEGESAS